MFKYINLMLKMYYSQPGIFLTIYYSDTVMTDRFTTKFCWDK